MRTALALAAAFVMLFPVYWLIATSLKSRQEAFAIPPSLWPQTVVLQPYLQNLGDPALWGYIGNSLQLGVLVVVLSVGLGAPAAYSLARLPIRGKGAATLVLLLLQVFPAVMLATPLFTVFSAWGLTNSLVAVALASATRTLPFSILVLRPFFAALPRELEDAAYVDGASRLSAFTRIILPSSTPALATVASLAFLAGWGEFLFALTLISDDAKRPLALGLYSFMSEYNTKWNDLMAVSVIAAIPGVIVFLFAQRYLVSGLTVGSTVE